MEEKVKIGFIFFFKVTLCEDLVCEIIHSCEDSLKGITQEKADLAAGVAQFALTLVTLWSVELWFDLPNTGHLLFLFTMEIRTGELLSHGLGPTQRE